MKTNRVLVLAAAALLAGSIAYAQETETPETEAVDTATLSDDWKDFQIQIDGQVYQFPMMYSDFTALGWSADEEDQELELNPNQYTMIQFEKDDVEVTAYVLNLAINTLSARECIIGGMDIDNFYWDLTEGSITLPGGIVRGEADIDFIETTYGTPSSTYEGGLYDQITYETDYNSSVEMQIYKESGVLENVDIRNFVEPEGFDEGEASEEVPESVAVYTKPEALGEALTEYQIEVEGEIYRLPVPVRILVADGWEIDESDTAETISAHSSGWVTLRRGGQEIRDLAYNGENYATIPENCWIEEIALGEYETNVDGSLPAGITIGMAEEDFLTVLGNAGISYEQDESGNYRYYSFSNPQYGQGYEVTVYIGDDSYFEQNTIMEISCSNSVEN